MAGWSESRLNNHIYVTQSMQQKDTIEIDDIWIWITHKSLELLGNGDCLWGFIHYH